VVASYNIHGAVGLDRRHDPDRIVRVLRALDADVIALQEVDTAWHYLAEATGMHAVAGVTRSSHRGHYGNAILTRLPVESQTSVPIGIDGREPRGVLQAVLRTGGETVSVINTHLGLRDHERRVQIVRVAALIGECTATRSIVAGDFNEWRGRAPALAPIVSHMGAQASLRTFPSLWPLFALDRIWARAPARIVSLEVVRTALTRRASDHLPIRAHVEL